MKEPRAMHTFTIDDLAQEIRRVDGNHSLGAGELAEALLPFVTKDGQEGAVDVDDLAQAIRLADGNHSLGAGLLAEALFPFLTSAAEGRAAPSQF